MTKKRIAQIVFLIAAALVMSGCSWFKSGGGTGPSPTPNPGPGPNPGEVVVPPVVFSPGQEETYTSPEGKAGSVEFRLPAGAFKVKVQKINPGRDSFLPLGYDVAINLIHVISPNIPNPEGAGYTPKYDLVDQEGNPLPTFWLGGGGNTFMPGTEGTVLWSTRVYEAPPSIIIPPSIYGLRVRWGFGPGGGGRGYVSGIEFGSQPISIVIPLRWHR